MRNGNKFYVDVRMQEWRMGQQSPRLQASVRKVLSELDSTALLLLKGPHAARGNGISASWLSASLR